MEVCYHCGNFINSNEKFVLLGTYNITNSDDNEQFFHFQCWEKYFNDRVDIKATKKKAVESSLQFLQSPRIRGMMESVHSAITGANPDKTVYIEKKKPKKKEKK